MARAEVPLVVQLPKAGADRPPLAKVGIVALVGFVVGMAWPRFTGTRIARSIPTSETTAAPSDTAGQASTPAKPTAPLGSASVVPGFAPPGSTPHSSPSSALLAPPPSALTPQPAAPAGGPLTVTVSSGTVQRCRDDNDDPIRDCGTIPFDPVAVPLLKGLSQCTPPAVPGTLSLGFDVDFHRQRIRPIVGKATTLPTETAQALLTCAQSGLKNASLSDIKHSHRRYTIFYHATFTAAGEAAPPPPTGIPEGKPAGTTTGETPASGNATVAWDAVVVRDAPRSGSIVGRMVRGTKVKLLARQGEWFRIRAATVEGWAYRGALGL